MGVLQCTRYDAAGFIDERVRSKTTLQRNTLLQSSIMLMMLHVVSVGLAPSSNCPIKLLRGKIFFLSLLMWFLNDKVWSSVTPY